MMIKKRYMIIALAILSVLLGSLLYSNLALAQRGKEPTEVDVINLPIDEQGNLRTTVVGTSKIMLVYNESLTVPSSISTYIRLTSVNTTGFKYAYITAKAEGIFEMGANIGIWYFDNNFGILTQPYAVGAMWINTVSQPYDPQFGTDHSPEFKLHSTSLDLYLQVYNSNVGFDGLLTIAVFLSN